MGFFLLQGSTLVLIFIIFQQENKDLELIKKWLTIIIEKNTLPNVWYM